MFETWRMNREGACQRVSAERSVDEVGLQATSIVDVNFHFSHGTCDWS